MITAAACGIVGLVRALFATQRYQYLPQTRSYHPGELRPGERFVYAFWHEALLAPAIKYGGLGVRVLISQHADGQLITEVAGRLGFDAVRGSTTRGGLRAMRQMLDADSGHLAMTPDGPRGPRRVVQPGVVYLASRAGLPIVPVGIGYDRPWRAASWDRFAVPRPFRKFVVMTDTPVVVPADADRDGLEAYRLRVQNELDRLTLLAESQAAVAVAVRNRRAA
jgi:lysophospholipid acyltransferase (LPLAT)-like uncharacterized protein